MLIRSTACASMLALIGLLGGCASIMHGSRQNVAFDSTPAGASVIVDGTKVGTTPICTDLDRGSEHDVTIELPGYTPQKIHLSRGVDGWFFGNLLLGGVIGLVVDASNGAMYKLDKDRVSVTLVKGTGVGPVDGLHVVVVDHVEDGLQKIGQLERAH